MLKMRMLAAFSNDFAINVFCNQLFLLTHMVLIFVRFGD